jgi:hypothetical protein
VARVSGSARRADRPAARLRLVRCIVLSNPLTLLSQDDFLFLRGFCPGDVSTVGFVVKMAANGGEHEGLGK